MAPRSRHDDQPLVHPTTGDQIIPVKFDYDRHSLLEQMEIFSRLRTTGSGVPSYDETAETIVNSWDLVPQCLAAIMVIAPVKGNEWSRDLGFPDVDMIHCRREFVRMCYVLRDIIVENNDREHTAAELYDMLREALWDELVERAGRLSWPTYFTWNITTQRYEADASFRADVEMVLDRVVYCATQGEDI